MKQYAVIFTPRTERQLAHLYGYIADQSGEARAETYVGKIVAACNALSMFPERGTKRNDIRPNMRTTGYAKSVTIAFSVNAKTEAVAVHGIFYGGQDVEFYGGQDVEQVLRDSISDDQWSLLSHMF